MRRPELTIVFLTDAWGPSHGGINSFNFDFSRALAAAYPSAIRVVNVVLRATDADMEDAASQHVELISVQSEDVIFRPEYAAEVLRKLEDQKVRSVDWWIGHDAVSGEVALKLKSIYPSRNSAVAIFHHMDYEAYLIFKKPNGAAVRRKIDEQKEIIKSADKIFAVGPYLSDSAKDICGENVTCIIPGLIDHIVPKPSPNVFKVIAFGRLGQQNEIIKQLELAVISFGKAIRRFSETNDIMSLPKMVVFGIEHDADQTERLSGLLEKNAGRKIPIVASPYIEDRQTLMDELASASVCMMLSLHEGFGLVAWEAIGVGVPIVISKTSGIYRFLWNIGGMATGCIGAVDVTGAPEIDEANVSAHLLEYMLRKEKAKKDIYNLRDILLKYEYNWAKAAKTFIEGLGVKLIDPPVRENLRSPYKFLDSFSEFEAELFFGRRTATEQLVKKILNEKLTVLFGIGGSGKTSLVRAGAIPALLSKGIIPLYVKFSGEDPLLSITTGLHEWLSKSVKDIAELKRELPLKGTLHGMLGAVEDFVGREVVLFIDRFEQLFLSHTLSKQEEFESQIHHLINNAGGNTHVVIVLREDFFPELYNFKSWNNIYQNLFRLKSLSENEAIEAIVSPARNLGINYEEGLPGIILSELRDDKGMIFPPQLQIICEQLFRKLGKTDKLLRIALYEDLGGAKQIIAEYLEDILDQFDGQSRTAAKAILKGMVDSRFSAIAISFKDASTLVREVIEWPEAKVEQVLQILINERLIRKSDEEKPYELTHEYLIACIREWIDLENLHLKEARELLKNNSFNWKKYGITIDRKALDLVNMHRDHLAFDDVQLSFMLGSAITYDIDLSYWMTRVQSADLAIEYLEGILEQPDELSKARAAVTLLYHFDDARVEKQGLTHKIWQILENSANQNLKIFISKIEEVGKPFPVTVLKKIRELIEKASLRDMVFVQEGEFTMGMRQEDIDSFIAGGAPAIFFEGRSKFGQISAPSFLIDKYLVTNNQYKAFDPDHTYPLPLDEHPATNINWFRAKAFAEWSGKTLPSEELWEKAARGTDGRNFPWGNNWDPDLCNTRLSGISGTTPVGKYPEGTSPYSCYDMAGNVWEWTSVWKEENKSILVKGGSWSKMKILPWCAYKFDYDAQEGLQNVGFRCVRLLNNDHLETTDKVYSAGGLVTGLRGGRSMVLLCRSDERDEWRLPKGMLKKGEDILTCASREIKEETGYEVTIGELLDFKSWSYQHEGKWFDEVAFFFLTKADPDQQPLARDEEFTFCEWFEPKTAIGILTYQAEQEIVNYWLNKCEI